MTFNAAVPLNSDSPSIFPAQNQTNMGRLQTLLGADHQFNLSASANDGYHNLIHMTQQAPSGALAATGRLYVKSSGGAINLFYMNDAGLACQISPTTPIRASVNFDGTGGNGAKSMRSQFNVSSVVRTGTGAYTINFTTAMPDNNYMVQITGMRDGSGSVSNGCVASNGSYVASIATTFVKVTFFGNTDTARDVLMGSVTIISAV